MKKNGFTLIEFIAVALLLGIIALIAIPAVSSTIKEVNKEAFIRTVETMVKSSNDKCERKYMKGKSGNNTTYITDNKYVYGDKFDLKGKLPNSALVEADEQCQVKLAAENDKYCARKKFDSDEIEIYDNDGDSNCIPDYEKIRLIDYLETDKEKKHEIKNSGESNGTYYNGKDPNNYIKVGDKVLRILGYGGNGIIVTGDMGNDVTLTLNNKFDGMDNGLVAYSKLSDKYLDGQYGIKTENGRIATMLYLWGISDGFIDLTSEINAIPSGLFEYYASVDQKKLNDCFENEYNNDNYSLPKVLSNCKIKSWLDKNTNLNYYSNDGAGNNENLFILSYINSNGEYEYNEIDENSLKEEFSKQTGISLDDLNKPGEEENYNHYIPYVYKSLMNLGSKLKKNNTTFILDENVVLAGGNGTKENPYTYTVSTTKPLISKNDKCFILTKDKKGIAGYDFYNENCPRIITIPEKINDITIEYIDSYAFSSDGGLADTEHDNSKHNIKKIVIMVSSPEYVFDLRNAKGLKIIKNNAFYALDLFYKLYLNDGLEIIENEAFSNSSLIGNITIPNTVKTIGNSAFYNTYMTLAFQENSQLTSIGSEAFSSLNNYQEKLVLPASLKKIGDYAFASSTAINEFHIPNGIEEMGFYSFEWTNADLIIDEDLKTLSNNYLDNITSQNYIGKIEFTRTPHYNINLNKDNISVNNSNFKYYYPGIPISLISNDEEFKSYTMNGTLITNNSFIMPEADVTIDNYKMLKVKILESPHNYKSNMDETYTATVPGASKIKIVFTNNTYVENNFDKIYITDKNGNSVGNSYYTKDNLAEKEFIINGDTVNIRLKSDGSVQYYGFKCKVMEAE